MHLIIAMFLLDRSNFNDKMQHPNLNAQPPYRNCSVEILARQPWYLAKALVAWHYTTSLTKTPPPKASPKHPILPPKDHQTTQTPCTATLATSRFDKVNSRRGNFPAPVKRLHKIGSTPAQHSHTKSRFDTSETSFQHYHCGKHFRHTL